MRKILNIVWPPRRLVVDISIVKVRRNLPYFTNYIIRDHEIFLQLKDAHGKGKIIGKESAEDIADLLGRACSGFVF